MLLEIAPTEFPPHAGRHPLLISAFAFCWGNTLLRFFLCRHDREGRLGPRFIIRQRNRGHSNVQGSAEPRSRGGRDAK